MKEVEIAVSDGTLNLTFIASVDNAKASAIEVIESTSSPENPTPTVSITSPADGSTFTAPASISITASASDTDGSVAKVEFFNGTTNWERIQMAVTDGAMPGIVFKWVIIL